MLPTISFELTENSMVGQATPTNTPASPVSPYDDRYRAHSLLPNLAGQQILPSPSNRSDYTAGFGSGELQPISPHPRGILGSASPMMRCDNKPGGLQPPYGSLLTPISRASTAASPTFHNRSVSPPNIPEPSPVASPPVEPPNLEKEEKSEDFSQAPRNLALLLIAMTIISFVGIAYWKNTILWTQISSLFQDRVTSMYQKNVETKLEVKKRYSQARVMRRAQRQILVDGEDSIEKAINQIPCFFYVTDVPFPVQSDLSDAPVEFDDLDLAFRDLQSHKHRANLVRISTEMAEKLGTEFFPFDVKPAAPFFLYRGGRHKLFKLSLVEVQPNTTVTSKYEATIPGKLLPRIFHASGTDKDATVPADRETVSAVLEEIESLCENKETADIAGLRVLRSEIEQELEHEKNVRSLIGTNYARILMPPRHPAIVFFYADWCGHCQFVKKLYAAIAEQFTELRSPFRFFKIDADRNDVPEMEINTVPTILLHVPNSKQPLSKFKVPQKYREPGVFESEFKTWIKSNLNNDKFSWPDNEL